MGDKEQLSGRCHPSYLLRFPVLLKPTVDLPHGWVEPHCRQGGLEQDLPDETVPAFTDPGLLGKPWGLVLYVLQRVI